ncbi:Gfo/Idh/MocA family oxidoreductase [Dermatophilaceae bacterium Soc4.6]
MFSISAGATPAAVSTKGTATPPRTRYAVVGAGWRASVFLRMAYLMPDRFEVTGVVTRRAEAGAELEAQWGVATFRDVETLLATDRPDFVVLSVPWPVTPELTRQLVAAGVPVLAETPPAPDAGGLRALWHDVGASGLVQVAEQYALMPLNAARLAVVDSGLIGTASSALVSSTHLYHAVALMRRLLGVGREGATVRAQTFAAELVDPITPAGWTHDTSAKPATTTLAWVDFGGDRMGRYDFTDNQWWNPLRPDHLVVRGSAGEIWDETVVRMADEVTPMTSRLERAGTGTGMNYEGLDLTHVSLDGRVVWRNAFEGARLSDDDLAVAQLLAQTGAWVRGEGEPPYPLAEACHDHLVGLAIGEAAESGGSVRVEPDVWS